MAINVSKTERCHFFAFYIFSISLDQLFDTTTSSLLCIFFLLQFAVLLVSQQISKMNKSNLENNNLPIGKSISKCKEDIRSILYRLKEFYAPCDLETARGFSENLIQR